MRRRVSGSILLLTIALAASAAGDAFALPANFTESVAFSVLTLPVAVRFSPDGRVFVAEKSGNIKVFDNLSDTTGPGTYDTGGPGQTGSRDAAAVLPAVNAQARILFSACPFFVAHRPAPVTRNTQA